MDDADPTIESVDTVTEYIPPLFRVEVNVQQLGNLVEVGIVPDLESCGIADEENTSVSRSGREI